MVHFNLIDITPTQNAVDRMHWTERMKLRDYWYEVVRGTCGMKSPRETKKKRVKIIRVAKRLIDDLNIPSGCKYLLDAFVSYGWLVDDSVKWCRVQTDQRKCKKEEEEHMEVIISSQDY